ncbi:ABC transporter permease [Paenarthrobacter sp. FR1]|uniref:ABC transporter permease n=1 Tax=Paenarthrobacter sp. FR1 TaxID=3439548 RepID=UPI003DA4A064
MPSSRTALRQLLLGALGIGLWLAVWEWSTTTGPLSGTAGLPTASETLQSTAALAVDPAFWGTIGQTFAMMLTGLLVAAIAGISLGILMGLSNAAFAALDPSIQFLRPVPPVVLLPLVLLVVGPTTTLGVILAAFTAVWPILVQTLVGVRGVDPVALETVRAMRLPWHMRQTSVILPSALPNIATGIRIAASSALMLAIGVGLLAGAPGLGRSILTAQQSGDGTMVFAIIIWSGLLGLATNALLTTGERRLTRNHGPREEVTP